MSSPASDGGPGTNGRNDARNDVAGAVGCTGGSGAIRAAEDAATDADPTAPAVAGRALCWAPVQLEIRKATCAGGWRGARGSRTPGHTGSRPPVRPCVGGAARSLRP